MTILRPAEFSASERDLFLAAAAARRRLAGAEAAGDEATAEDGPDADEADGVAQLDDDTAAVQLPAERSRTEERRAGKEWASEWRSRVQQSHKKKKRKKRNQS